jgi:hypothetical protein
MERNDTMQSRDHKVFGQIADAVVHEMSELRNVARQDPGIQSVELLNRQIEALQTSLGRAIVARAQIAVLQQLASSPRR